jgi:hypothetical protein
MRGDRRFERRVEAVNVQRPNAVAIVGDLVDGKLGDLGEGGTRWPTWSASRASTSSPANHEFLVDTDVWLRHLPTPRLTCIAHSGRRGVSPARIPVCWSG